MKKGQQLGLDELMIVNPGPSGTEGLFLGDDGALYKVHDLGEEESQGMGQFFLGEDGTLYQVQGLDPVGPDEPGEIAAAGVGEEGGRELGRYFLGEDGRLYEVVR